MKSTPEGKSLIWREREHLPSQGASPRCVRCASWEDDLHIAEWGLPLTWGLTSVHGNFNKAPMPMWQEERMIQTPVLLWLAETNFYSIYSSCSMFTRACIGLFSQTYCHLNQALSWSPGEENNLFFQYFPYGHITNVEEQGNLGEMRSWITTSKEGWAPKNWCFQFVVLEKTLESPLDSKENKAANPKGNQSWIFIGRLDAEAKAPILWPPDAKNWLTEKDPDAGKDGKQKRRATEDETVGWHRPLNGHEFEQTPGDSEGQGSLGC